MGDLLIAQRHADVCIPMGTPANQAARLISIFDPVVATLAESSRNLWMLGDTRGCIERARRAVELAREVRHPDSLAFALIFHGWMHGYREDWETCLRSTRGRDCARRPTWPRADLGLESLHSWLGARAYGQDRGWPCRAAARDGGFRPHLGQIAMTQFCAMLSEVLLLRGDHARALEEIRQMLTAERNQPRSLCQRGTASAGRRVPSRARRTRSGRSELAKGD